MKDYAKTEFRIFDKLFDNDVFSPSDIFTRVRVVLEF